MLRILIILDEEEIRTMLRQVLIDEGYDVEEAADCAEGTELCRKKPADLIITDMIMPKKEGMENIADLRREFPNVKIIAISEGGRVEPEPYLEIAEGLGADRIFTKPFSIAEVLDAIQRILT
jgi:DNA-binding response OmpR family regulator